MGTIRSESLKLCLQLIRLRQEYHATTFGKLILESKGEGINIYEKSSTANHAEDIIMIVNACINLTFYIKYNSDKCEFEYHIF